VTLKLVISSSSKNIHYFSYEIRQSSAGEGGRAIAMSFEVGQNVRVIALDESISAKAIISYDNDDGTYDVIYSKTATEEAAVASKRVQPLFDFEDTSLNFSEVELKDQGNILFKEKDYQSAKLKYLDALDYLTSKCNVKSIGTYVIVPDDSVNEARLGMISSIDDNMLDIIYCDDMEPTEADGVEESSVTALLSGSDLDIQRTLYMNLSKCMMKLHQNGWCIKWANFAILAATCALLVEQGKQGERNESPERTNQLTSNVCDAHFLRGKCLLLSNRPKLATEVRRTTNQTRLRFVILLHSGVLQGSRCSIIFNHFSREPNN